MAANRFDDLDMFATLGRTAAQMSAVQTVSDLCALMARELERGFDGAGVAVFLSDSDQQHLRRVNGPEVGAGTVEAVPFGQGVVGSVAQSGRSEWIDDLARDPRAGSGFTGQGSEICAPFEHDGKVVGVIDCVAPQVGRFGQFHLDLLNTVAHLMGNKLGQLRNEEKFTLALRGANDGVWDWDVQSNEVEYSERWFEMLGRNSEGFPKSIDTWMQLINPDDLAGASKVVEDCVSGARETYETEFRMLHKDGHWVDILSRAFPVRVNGRVIRLIGTHVDISQLKRQAEEIHRNELRLKESLRVAHLAGWEMSTLDHLQWTPELCELFGLSPQADADCKRDFFEFVHRADLDQVRCQFNEAWQRGSRLTCVHRVVLTDGVTRTMRTSADTICDDTGTTVKLVGVMQDVTEQIALETQLHQAQKMEAVGQMTGGVAHDFNNLLAVIQGNAELLEDLQGSDADCVTQIIQAAERGASLTQRLLAFSRRQPLKPEPIDLRDLVDNIGTLIARVLGETISVETRFRGEGWGAFADRGQVENAILNLAINARDAMPMGGQLLIECHEVAVTDDLSVQGDLPAGDYVVLAVSDTGEGMPPEVQEHAFEPFFTTKGAGKGSGLGLSMIYGFAQQSGGMATIDSTLGQGTTVQLHLPRAKSAAMGKNDATPDVAPVGQDETVLILEDDPAVRSLVETMVTKLGYRVIGAANATEATLLLETHPETALVLSDVVLPGGTSGPEFAQQTAAWNSEIGFVFMSGYPAPGQKGVPIGRDRILLNKPFTISQLGRALRETLAR